MTSSQFSLFRVILIIRKWVANLVWGVGVLLNNSDPLQQLSAKEGGGLIFEGGLREITVLTVFMQLAIEVRITV